MSIFVSAKQKGTDHTLTIDTERASEKLVLYFETYVENIPGKFSSTGKARSLIYISLTDICVGNKMRNSFDKTCMRLGFLPIPVATRSKAWICSHSLCGITGANPTGGHAYLSLVSVVCCKVNVSASG